MKNLMHYLLSGILICFLNTPSFSQCFEGMDDYPSFIDLEAAGAVGDSATQVYNKHVEKILSYIPVENPEAQAIAKKYIKKYHQKTGYPENRAGSLSKTATEFVLLVRYDILKELSVIEIK